MSAPTIAVPLKVHLPEDIYEQYSRAAELKGHLVEDELAEQLTKYAHVPSQKPIILSDDKRREIEQLIRVNLNDADDLVRQIGRLTIINVGGIEVKLST